MQYVKNCQHVSITESTSVRDIVLDMTGFDLNLVTKEDLHKEKVERYVSPMTITPAPSTITPEPEPTPEPQVDKHFPYTGLYMVSTYT